jgi:coenzyme Q-binding protein COQ10
MTTFHTRRRVPFAPRQMFDLVADVERYPKFLPLCEALVVRKRERQGGRETLVADMTVGYRAIRETFTSRVTLDPERLLVRAETYEDDPGPFLRLENRWTFFETPGGCEVDFFIAYQFRSRMLQWLVGSVFDRAVRRFSEAFEQRARDVYGEARQASAARA